MWVPFGNSCYHFVHGKEDVTKSYSIELAKDLCHGYALLTVNSEEENTFVVNYSSEVWKGNVNVWLGMYYDSDQMVWQTEEPLYFTNWGTISEELASMDTCAALNASSGIWDIVSCEETSENGVVCETLQEPEKKSKKSGTWLLSALVILSVVVILGVSAVIWFMQQRHSFGPVFFTAFEFHPPFRTLAPDEACLMEVETGPLP
ncbi:CD302 antigen [Brienomyrus brachyistius]|uniref:CD302 antigen n=1 Tax=Brienomyrus brachyistius TaxID=42636 RepID=UPI0020B2D626|nr:CD302 antigen [Brienomyrus brachyistius]